MKRMVIASHPVNSDDLESILEDGLVRHSRGELGDDKAIVATDQLLDKRRPDSLLVAGVSRDDNIYAYVHIHGHVIDIVDGSELTVAEFIRQSEEVVLELRLDAARCFVSSLDQYDALKHAMIDGATASLLDSLADQYWHSLVPLTDYDRRTIARPEIMITYDVKPSDITKCA